MGTETSRGGSYTARERATQVLTTSSMTGSGLAASSCSFTFSSTRGCKNNTDLLERNSCLAVVSLRGPREGEEPQVSCSSLSPRLPLSHRSERGLVSQAEGRPQGPERDSSGLQLKWTRSRTQSPNSEMGGSCVHGKCGIKSEGYKDFLWVPPGQGLSGLSSHPTLNSVTGSSCLHQVIRPLGGS